MSAPRVRQNRTPYYNTMTDRRRRNRSGHCHRPHPPTGQRHHRQYRQRPHKRLAGHRKRWPVGTPTACAPLNLALLKAVKLHAAVSLIAAGGIAKAAHIAEYRAAGAAGYQVGAAMLDEPKNAYQRITQS